MTQDSMELEIDVALAKARAALDLLCQRPDCEGVIAELAAIRDLIASVQVRSHLPRLGAKRANARAEHLMITIISDKAGKRFECAIADMSVGGAHIIVPAEAVFSDDLQLDLPWLRHPVRCRIRERNESDLHVHFVELSTSDQTALQRVVEKDLERAI
jgi:hypothetical protein